MRLKVITDWVAAQAPALLAVERAVITLAALAALLPLWQFWSEQEDREIDRAANFVLAFVNCADIFEKDAELSLAASVYGPAMLRRFEPSEVFRRGIELGSSGDPLWPPVPADWQEAFKAQQEELAVKQREYAAFLRQGVTKECNKISELNETG